MTKIYVVDIESSGLNSFPRDIALQIGITKVDTEEKTVVPIFDKVLGYDTNQWPERWRDAWIFSNSSLKLKDIDAAYAIGDYTEKIGKKAHDILVGQKIAIYNLSFDYSNYLRKEPFNVTRRNSTLLPCLMVFSTDICKIPMDWGYGQFKWPKLAESYEMLVNKKIQKSLNINWHTAISDTQAAGWLLLELIKKHNYKVD